MRQEKKKEEESLAWRMVHDVSIRGLEENIKKTNYSSQLQQGYHKNKQKNNKVKKTSMRVKTNVWILQATNR